MTEQYSRTEMLLGEEALARLAGKRIAVFGLGGVGGYVVEGLARSAAFELDLIDDDCVSESNLNRQIIALQDTVGVPKTDAAQARVHAIAPALKVHTHRMFFLPETADRIDFSVYDYVVDAVDTVAAKLAIIEGAKKAGVPVISCMGCGNRLDPTKLRVSDISKTEMDPLAKVIRRELRKRGIRGVTVVWSAEPPIRPLHAAPAEPGQQAPAGPGQEPPAESGQEPSAEEVPPADLVPPAEQVPPAEAGGEPLRGAQRGRKDVPGSMVFVPAAAGLTIASVIVRQLAAE